MTFASFAGQLYAPSGVTGATATTRYVGATASGAPSSGTFSLGDFIIDQTGQLWVCTVAGTPGTWVTAGGQSPPNETPASGLGLLAWNYPNINAGVAAGTVTSGTIYIMRIPLNGQSITVTNIVMGIFTAGATLTNNECFAGLYNSAGLQVGVTADQHTLWASAGVQTMALVGGPFVVSGNFVYVAVVSNGTTNPLFCRGAGGGVGPGLINLGLTAANLLAAVNGTAQTTLPGSLTYSSNVSAASQDFWVALS
jgi:hypothetical protein